jgi:hypothetical protein
MRKSTSITILGLCLGAGIYLLLVPTKTGEPQELKTKEAPRSINLPANNPNPDYQWASSNSKYEIRIQNDVTDERLETVKTLEEAMAYLKRYAMHHNDLFVYDISSGTLVAGVAEGSSFEMAVD